MCGDKNCQSTKLIHMWPVKSALKSSQMWSRNKQSHMWSVRPVLCPYVLCCIGFLLVSLRSSDPLCLVLCFSSWVFINSNKHKITLWLSFIKASIHMYIQLHVTYKIQKAVEFKLLGFIYCLDLQRSYPIRWLDQTVNNEIVCPY